MPVNISVITIVHKRDVALRNTLMGLSLGTVLPSEIVIVHMNEDCYELPSYPTRIKQIQIDFKGSLNLSAARNIGLESSDNEHNIFLDVDCIPSKDLVEKYLRSFAIEDCLYSGRINYLPEKALIDFKFTECYQEELKVISKSDPIRGSLQEFSYELFWSLNFGCSKSNYEKIGGFDESFIGYGAEDTDFSFTARKNEVLLKTIDAYAFHQYHQSYDPPINHLEFIIINARRFYKKWQLWPMEGWLNKFEKMGLISRDNGRNIPYLVRIPTKNEIDLAKK